MARQINNKKGFSPENLLAGLNTDIDPKKEIEDEFQVETALNNYEKTSRDTNNTDLNLQDTDNNFEDSQELINEDKARLSLEALVKKNEPKKSQENVYLHEDVKDALEAFGKLIGKTNGGKSYVVETALLEYFERNKDYLNMARKQYSKRKRK
jgi:hypothetical protein